MVEGQTRKCLSDFNAAATYYQAGVRFGDSALEQDGIRMASAVATQIWDVPSNGFRFDAPGRSVCYLSDHEPYGKLNAAGSFSQKEDAAVADFVSGCDLLISEAQYTDEEYKVKKTWGHSTFTDFTFSEPEKSKIGGDPESPGSRQ